VLDSAILGRNIAVPKQKAGAIEDVLPAISVLRNAIQKRDSFDQAMNFFRVDDTALRRELWNAVKNGGPAETTAVKQQIARATKVKMTVAEQQLLELLIYDRELREMILPLLESSDYEALATASIFRALYDLQARDEEPVMENLLELTDGDEAAQDYIPLLMMSEPKRAGGEAIDQVLHDAENCVFTLRFMALENRTNAVTQELIHAEQTGDLALVGRLAIEKMELGKIELQLRQKIKEV
jgi:hypothetical protein